MNIHDLKDPRFKHRAKPKLQSTDDLFGVYRSSKQLETRVGLKDDVEES